MLYLFVAHLEVRG